VTATTASSGASSNASPSAPASTCTSTRSGPRSRVFYLESNPGDTYGLKELLGHVSFETTEVYLRKLDKGTAMERVRDLSWTTPTPPKPIVDDGYVDEPASWVYFIAAGDVAVDGTPVKIGWAGDPQARLSDLQSGHHAELVLVAAVPGGVGLEAHFHAELAADRLRGEWFSSSPSLRGLIASSQTRMDRGLAANLLTEASRLVGVGGFEPPKDDGRHVERAGDQSRPAEVDQ
jgi:hypothetical protein